MTSDPLPKRDRSGRFLPKWASEAQREINLLHSDFRELDSFTDGLQIQIADLRSRIGSIGWQIVLDVALFAGLGYLLLAHFMPGSVP